MLKSSEIQQRIKNNMTELNHEYAVSKIGIFGSYARNEPTLDSDLDILVDFSKPVGFISFMQLEQHLHQLLGIKIDLVTRAALRPRIGEHILKEVKYVQ